MSVPAGMPTVATCWRPSPMTPSETGVAAQPPELVRLPGRERGQVVQDDVAGRAVRDHPRRVAAVVGGRQRGHRGARLLHGGRGQVGQVGRLVVAARDGHAHDPAHDQRRSRGHAGDRHPAPGRGRSPGTAGAPGPAGAQVGRRSRRRLGRGGDRGPGGSRGRRGGRHDRQRGRDVARPGLGRDALPHRGRGRLVRGQRGQRRPVLVHDGGAGGAAGQVGLDDQALVVVQGVEGVDRQLVEGMLLVTHGVTPSASRARRSLPRPERMRLLTVPSGWPSASAVSR